MNNQAVDLRHLNDQEQANPVRVINDFFSDDSLEGHLQRLRQWRDSVLANDYFRGDKGNPSELLYFQRLNLRLLEALYALVHGDEPYLSEPITMIAAVFRQGCFPIKRPFMTQNNTSEKHHCCLQTHYSLETVPQIILLN